MDADKKYNWTEFTGFFRIDVDQSKTSRNLVNPVNPVYCFLDAVQRQMGDVAFVLADQFIVHI